MMSDTGETFKLRSGIVQSGDGTTREYAYMVGDSMYELFPSNLRRSMAINRVLREHGIL